MSMIKKDKPKHLGRGLEALLGPINQPQPEQVSTFPVPNTSLKFPPDKIMHESLKEIAIDSIETNPYQPRTVWNQQDLNDLASSIAANGVIQPIIVRQKGPKFEIIAGERRVRASQQAGLTKIPAIIRNANDEQMLELALVENIHRTDLNAIERAKAYQRYITTFNLTQSDAAERLGEDRSVVANFIRLLELPEEIKQMLVDGSLSVGHARAILALPNDDLRRKLANRAMAGRLSVREVERLVAKCLSDNNLRKSDQPLDKAPHIQDLENRLTSHLGTKVSIDAKRKGNSGKIVIEFYSLDDFDRITELLGLAQIEQG